MIERDGACTEEDETEGEGGEREREFVTPIAHQSVMEVDLGDGDGQIDANGKSREAGEQADQHEDAAKKFGKGGKVCGPAGESKTGDELNVVLKAAENFMVSVANHDGAQGKAHDKESQGLQAIKVAQVASGERTNRLQQGSERWKRVAICGRSHLQLRLFPPYLAETFPEWGIRQCHG
jgi:hypothetical protein